MQALDGYLTGQSNWHIAATEKMLDQYFNRHDNGVEAALYELKRLGSLRIAVKAPDIQSSLVALDTLKAR